LALLLAAALLVASVALIDSPRAPLTSESARLHAAADSLLARIDAGPVDVRSVDSPTGPVIDFSLEVDGARVVPSLVRIRSGSHGAPVVRGLSRSLPEGSFPAARGIDPLAISCARVDTLGGLRGAPSSFRAWFRDGGAWRPGWIARIPLDAYRGDALPWLGAPPEIGTPVDLELRFDPAGTLLEARDLLVHAAVGRGSVFDPNPIVASGREELRDGDAVDAWQVPVDLPGLGGERLWGERVRVDSGKSPKAAEPSLTFQYPSNDPRFEEVMAYYHIDRARAWLDSLGYGGYFPEAQRVTVHAAPIDNSWYSPITKRVEFGDGGVDDAEDADILVHEFGHAVHDAFVPGFGDGDTRAISEGFADYLAATRSGDPCIAEWDATSYSPPCLRRIDVNLHEPEDRIGSAHADGRIWSGALWAIRTALGAPLADRIALEGLLRQAPDSSLRDAAAALLTGIDDLGLTSERETVRMILIERGLIPRAGQLQLAGEGHGEVPLDRPWPAAPEAPSVRFDADGAVTVGSVLLWPLRMDALDQVSIDYEAAQAGFAWTWEMRSGAAEGVGGVVLGADGALELSWGVAPEIETWPDGLVEVVRAGKEIVAIDLAEAFTLEELPPSFRLVAPGAETTFGVARLRLVPTGTGWRTATALPPGGDAHALVRVLGQPAYGSARIRVEAPQSGVLEAGIFDATGRRVRRLAEAAPKTIGPRLLTWDGLDDAGRRVASGVYWIRLRQERGAATAKILFFDR
jgi:hypothetical protein